MEKPEISVFPVFAEVEKVWCVLSLIFRQKRQPAVCIKQHISFLFLQTDMAANHHPVIPETADLDFTRTTPPGFRTIKNQY
jgi:hypothetical protein